MGIVSVDIVQSGDLIIGSKPFSHAKTKIALS